MDAAGVSQPLTTFLDWVRTLIPKDKYFTFVSLFKFPTPTIQHTNSIYNELERVFDGKNPSCNFQFTDSHYRDDFEWYRTDVLGEPNIWREKSWNAMKTAINSILVVDLPAEQSGEYPEPYYYFLDISKVIDYDTKNNKIEWIIFKQPDNRITVIDSARYMLIQLNEDNEISEILIDNPHDLGYCPAQFFWSSALTQSHPDIKKAPISSQLSNLDWLLFFATSKKHLDLYAPYPIYSTYEADCDFHNNATGDYCDGGYLRNQNQEYKLMRNGSVEPCPVCSNKRLAGVGSMIEIPVPLSKDDVDLKNPVQITTIDSASLDWNVKEEQRLEAKIFTAVVGVGGNITKESINELQVEANFESRVSVLNALKGNLESAQKFVDDTVCRLRYGENFLGSSISMGSEFYIYSVADLYEQYKQAKDNGSGDAILDALMWQIIETEYREDPTELQRMGILKHLEPYRHFTFDELLRLSDKQLLDEELLVIKLNFSTFIDRFERENTNIIEFGSQLPFDSKIKIILNKLKDYVREEKRGRAPSQLG